MTAARNIFRWLRNRTGWTWDQQAVVVIVIGILIAAALSGCKSQTEEPDPNPREPLMAARQALVTIHRWAEEANAPKFVMDAFMDLEGWMNRTETVIDAEAKVTAKREKEVRDKIADLENTVWERSLRTIVSAIAIFGVAGGVWMIMTGGSKFGPATIGASIAAVFAMRFVQATGPMATIIGYSVGGAVAVLLMVGVYVRGRAMLAKHDRDTMAIQEKIISDESAEATGTQPKSMETILRSMPESASAAVKSLTRRAKKRLGLPEQLTDPV